MGNGEWGKEQLLKEKVSSPDLRWGGAFTLKPIAAGDNVLFTSPAQGRLKDVHPKRRGVWGGAVRANQVRQQRRGRKQASGRGKGGGLEQRCPFFRQPEDSG